MIGQNVIEKTDTEIVGLAFALLLEDTLERVIVVTNDIPLGEAAETLILQYGFDDQQVLWLTCGEFADELGEDFLPRIRITKPLGTVPSLLTVRYKVPY